VFKNSPKRPLIQLTQSQRQMLIATAAKQLLILMALLLLSPGAAPYAAVSKRGEINANWRFDVEAKRRILPEESEARNAPSSAEARRLRFEQGIERRKASLVGWNAHMMGGEGGEDLRFPPVDLDSETGLVDAIRKNRPVHLEIDLGDRHLGTALNVIPEKLSVNSPKRENSQVDFDGTANANSLVMVILPSAHPLPTGILSKLAVDAVIPSKSIIFQPDACEYDSKHGIPTSQLTVPKDAAEISIPMQGQHLVSPSRELKIDPTKPIIIISPTDNYNHQVLPIRKQNVQVPEHSVTGDGKVLGSDLVAKVFPANVDLSSSRGMTQQMLVDTTKMVTIVPALHMVLETAKLDLTQVDLFTLANGQTQAMLNREELSSTDDVPSNLHMQNQLFPF